MHGNNWRPMAWLAKRLMSTAPSIALATWRGGGWRIQCTSCMSRSNNLPNTVISGHLLSNAANSNAYDGDFSKVAGLMMSAKAVLGGETIPLRSDVFYDKIYKCWFVDSHLSCAFTPNRAEYAAAIMLP